MQLMRYCQYNLGEGSSKALLDDLRNHNDQVPQVRTSQSKKLPVLLRSSPYLHHSFPYLQALRDKMEAVLTTSRKAQALSLDHINWDGVRNIPINSEDIRVVGSLEPFIIPIEDHLILTYLSNDRLC